MFEQLIQKMDSARLAIAEKYRFRHFPVRLSRHFFLEYMIPLCGTVAAFTMLSLLLAVFDDLPDFSGKNVPGGVTLLYFIACIPKNLVMVLPFASLLAVSFMMMMLGKNNELTAVRSAGISILKVCMPIGGVALVLGGCIMLINECVIPAANDYVTEVQEVYLSGHKKKQSNNNHLAYYSRKYRRHWFFSGFNHDEFQGVVMRQMDDKDRTEYVLACEQAKFLQDEKQWRFMKVSRTDYSYQENDLALQLPPVFEEEMMFDFPECPRDMFLQSQNYENLSLRELYVLKRNAGALEPQMRRLVASLCVWRLFSPLSVLIATLLGGSLTIAVARRGATTGFVCAVIIFMAYVLIDQFVLFLGKNGSIPAWLAGCSMTLCFLAGAGYLAYKRQ